MKQLGTIGVLAVLCFLVGCTTVTQHQLEYGKTWIGDEPTQFENEDLQATLYFSSPKRITLEVENKTDSVIIIVMDLASFNGASGTSSRLVPEGTKYINTTESHPSEVIPPKGKYRKGFISADSIHFVSGSSGGWETDDWVPNKLAGTKYVFGYKTNTEDRFIVFSKDMALASGAVSPELLGSVVVSEQFWNILFLRSVEERRKILFDKAMNDATKKYGKNIRLRNLDFQGSWSGLSLVLYFSILGFVEDASLTADVIAQ